MFGTACLCLVRITNHVTNRGGQSSHEKLMWWCRFQGSWTLLGNYSNKNLELWNSEEDSTFSEEDSTFVIVTLWLTIMYRARWKQKEIKSTNHHSMSHLTMIHRWRWTVVQHHRHCRHFHLSAAMRMFVIHF